LKGDFVPAFRNKSGNALLIKAKVDPMHMFDTCLALGSDEGVAKFAQQAFGPATVNMNVTAVSLMDFSIRRCFASNTNQTCLSGLSSCHATAKPSSNTQSR